VTSIAQLASDNSAQRRYWRAAFAQTSGIDLLLFLYIVVFIRQYLWIVTNNRLAWSLTILLSLAAWSLHLYTKQAEDEKVPARFWLVVVLPLFLFYALRAAFPDTSFDVLDYRLMNAERALRGLPLRADDFFPVRFPFNPAPDMLTGISRHLLGYRLGTILNFLVLTWVAIILDRFLRPYLKAPLLRSFCVLLLLLTEHALFLINNYMVDLLALPLLLESARLTMQMREPSRQQTIRVALMLGASVALKLTNLAFALPIVLVYAYYSAVSRHRATLGLHALLFIAAFAFPLLPYTLYIYWQTGNPVFPLYNKIFHSPFWPTTDYAGVRWGPVVDDPRFANMRWWEVVAWPLLVPFRIEHVAGDLGRHAGRLSIVFIGSVIGLITTRKDRRVWIACSMTVCGALLWSAISGMPRYALYLEFLRGIAAFAVMATVFQTNERRQHTALMLLLAVLTLQSATAVVYGYRFEWGSRVTFFDNPKAYINEATFFFRDYSLEKFLPRRERELISPAGAWLESSALESGIDVALKSDNPALCVYMPEFFSTDTARQKFKQAIQANADRRMFSLSFTENLQIALNHIERAGLKTGLVHQIVVPYYSEHTRIHMALIEVLRDAAASKQQIKITRSDNPLPAEALRAELKWSQQPAETLRQRLKETVYVVVKNVSDFSWPALGRNDGTYRIFLGNHWRDENDHMLVNDDGRSILVHDLAPGQELEVPITITAPAVPGTYVLELDMVQEGATWFTFKGSKTLRTTIRVE